MHKALLAIFMSVALLLPAPILAQTDSDAAAERQESKDQKNQKKKKKKAKDDVDAIGEREVGKGINFYSLEKEIALGKQFADEIEKNARIVNDPVIAEYVNRVGQNLVRNSDAQIPFYFKVIDAEEINAFALPGGYCFVNTGLLMKAESEGEFAGVLAHEIAHVTARHGTKQATRGQIANLASIPLMIMLGGSWTGYAIGQGIGMAIPIGFLQFSRQFEAEADFLGLQYLYKAGYDPTSFVDFFEKLQALEKRRPGALASVFRSHPMTDDRIAETQKEIQRILPSRPEYLVSTSEFLAVKDRFARLLAENRTKDPAKDGPVLRRTSAPTGTIDPNDTRRRPTDTADDDGGPPVLKRKDGQAPGTIDPSEAGSSPRTSQDDDGPPVLKRKDPAPSGTIDSGANDAGTNDAGADETDDGPPVLRRKN